MLMLISLIIISFLLDTIVLNKLGKFSTFWSIIISIGRIIGSLIYTKIFPDNDLSAFHWDGIIACKNEIIFKFSSLAKFFYCNDILKEMSQINLIYSFIGTVYLSILIRLSKYIQIISFDNYQNNRSKKISDQISKYFQIILLLTPNSLFYTSVISKDIFQFCFVVSILLFFIRPSLISAINFIFASLFILFSRPYVIFIFGLSVVFSLIIPNFYLKVNQFKYILQIRDKYKALLKRYGVILLLLPILPFLIEFIIPFLGVKGLETLSANEVIDRWNVDMGGNLAISADTNVFLKYIFFWILPMPILQSGTGALVIGLSTLFTLFLVFKILEKGISIDNFKLKFLFSTIIIYSTSFAITMSNSGITSRYRFTTILPILYILYYISNYQLNKINFLNSKS